MRRITNKQLKAISNLLNFINNGKNDFGPHDHDWFERVDHITNLYKHGKLQNLHSTSKETQDIFHFLIKGMEYMNQRIRMCNASNHHSYNSPEARWNRLQGESICDGYWDNPLF